MLLLSGTGVVNAEVVTPGIAGGVDPDLYVAIADRRGPYPEMLIARETDDGRATMLFFEHPCGHLGTMFPRSVVVRCPGAGQPRTRFWFPVDDWLLVADKAALSR